MSLFCSHVFTTWEPITAENQSHSSSAYDHDKQHVPSCAWVCRCIKCGKIQDEYRHVWGRKDKKTVDMDGGGTLWLTGRRCTKCGEWTLKGQAGWPGDDISADYVKCRKCKEDNPERDGQLLRRFCRKCGFPLGEQKPQEAKAVAGHTHKSNQSALAARAGAIETEGTLPVSGGAHVEKKETVYHSVFISYSKDDREFAERLFTDLKMHEVQCWFAPEDLKIGDKFHDRIEHSIQSQEKLLLILSRSSIQSTWVEREVKAAMEREERRGSQILFPIRIDEEIMQSDKSWAADIRRQRHIGNFCLWHEENRYQLALMRLLRDLKV
jgi:hypothetical protein